MFTVTCLEKMVLILFFVFFKLMYIFAVFMLHQHRFYYTYIYKGKGKLDLMNTYDNYFVFNMFDARFSIKKSRALETCYSKHS